MHVQAPFSEHVRFTSLTIGCPSAVVHEVPTVEPVRGDEADDVVIDVEAPVDRNCGQLESTILHVSQQCSVRVASGTKQFFLSDKAKLLKEES